jgi:hypothetical protein
MVRRLANIRRRPAKRDPKRRFVIVCEGKNSEPFYLRALARRSPAVLDLYEGSGTPEVVAELAIEKAKELGIIGKRRARLAWYERADEAWAVFDRDEHMHFDSAVRMCKENGIKVARSNPCFEVWLILHYEEFHKPDERDQVLAHLCSLCPSYKAGKGRYTDFDSLLDNLEQAEKRGEAQCAARAKEGDEYGPPSTTVFMLTKAMRNKK